MGVGNSGVVACDGGLPRGTDVSRKKQPLNQMALEVTTYGFGDTGPLRKHKPGCLWLA